VLRELEARLNSIITFRGLQNSKAAEKATEDIAAVREQSQQALKEAQDRFAE